MRWDILGTSIVCRAQRMKDIFEPSDSFIEYLTQDIIFHVKSQITKYEFWGLLVLKSQDLMFPNLTWKETWNLIHTFKKIGWEYDVHTPWYRNQSMLKIGSINIGV